MSFTKKDRNIRIGSGNVIPEKENDRQFGSAEFATIVSEALRREYGGTNAAVKVVVRLTHANERAVKNWFSAKNAQGGPHLVSLMRHSDQVLEVLLLLAGRKDLVTSKKISDVRKSVRRMLDLIDTLLADG